MKIKFFLSSILLIVPLNCMERTISEISPKVTSKFHTTSSRSLVSHEAENFLQEALNDMYGNIHRNNQLLHAAVRQVQDAFNKSFISLDGRLSVKVVFSTDEQKTDPEKRRATILYGPLSEKNNALIKVYAVLQHNDDKDKSDSSEIENIDSIKIRHQLAYSKLVSKTRSIIKKIAGSDEWKIVSKFAQSLLLKSDQNLWYSIIIDSVYEHFKDQGLTKLIIAIELNDMHKMDEWIQGYLVCCSIDKIDSQLNVSLHDTTALISAIRKDDNKIISLLLSEKDLKIDVTTDEGATALSVASLRGKAELVDTLLGQNIDLLEKKMINGYSALHIAAEMGHSQVVIVLLKRKPLLEERASTGKTPLQIGISKKSPTIVQLLLDSGADANGVCNDMSPLILAMEEYSVEKKSPFYDAEKVKKAREVLLILLNSPKVDKSWCNQRGKNAVNFARLYLKDDADLSSLLQ